MKCIWIERRECQYLITLENVTGKKDIPQLEDFTVFEICELCLLALKVNMIKQ
jgi:hypothetical protein